MKRIKIFIAAVAAFGSLTACNLDYYPGSAINTEEAMETVQDCQGFRNGLYSGMKYCFTGGFVYAPELQTDLYHAVRNFGNFQGEWYHYSVQPSTSLAGTAWFGIYEYIANANFLIDGVKKLIDGGTLSAQDVELLRQYYGEACYIRAHMYYLLTQYFCEDYEPDTAEETLGIPVVTKYDPTPDASKYPERGTLAKTFEQILYDLQEAETYLKTEGSQNSMFVTADVVTALQARVALAMHDYDRAFSKAKSLIDGGKYVLETDADKYAEGWVKDNLTETLWQVKMTGPDDVGNSFNYFIYNTSGVEGNDNPQYVPEQWVLDLYAKEGFEDDIRYDAYFDERNLTSPVTGTLTLMVKYPGNPQLYTAVTNYVNQPKVFRISEMYLIAAESMAMKGGQDAVACIYLNDLREKRIPAWEDKTYTGDALKREIREERVRELFGEGFRLNDLKRWHMGFERDEGQDPDLVQPGDRYAGCTRPADDPYFVWPIPLDEMEANPQMKQNPAYIY